MNSTYSEKEVDILVVGGGTAGPMAAIRAKEANPLLNVMLIEKANVKRSGAISMGMDGLNNAVIPGHATPEQYVREITIANDGVVNQKAILAYANNSFQMIQRLDKWGVKFEKDETGEFAVKKVHHLGNYVLPMPEGHNVKKILYRLLRKNRIDVTNRYKVTRVVVGQNKRVSGVMAVDTRTAEITLIKAKAVIICTG
ncbi:FAD-binding protein, partial [Acidithiobacillus ferriphilus]